MEIPLWWEPNDFGGVPDARDGGRAQGPDECHDAP
jgi:hypothetical protein